MTTTETLNRVINLERHDGQLPTIRRLWPYHLAEVNKKEKDYTLWAIAVLVGAWIAFNSVLLNVMP